MPFPPQKLDTHVGICKTKCLAKLSQIPHNIMFILGQFRVVIILGSLVFLNGIYIWIYLFMNHVRHTVAIIIP